MSKDWFMLSPSNVINNQQPGRLASNIAAGNQATEFFNSIDPQRTLGPAYEIETPATPVLSRI